MPFIQVGRRILAIKYDGTNASEVLDMFAPHAIIDGCTVSLGPVDGDGMLTINHTYPGQPTTPYKQIARNAWTIADWSDSTGILVTNYPDSIFQAAYRSMAQVASATAATTEFTDAVKAAVAASAGAFGIATVPALQAGGNSNVAVTIKPTMANTSYTAAAFISGGTALLGALNITSVTKASTSVVTVGITNTGLATLNGALVMVHVTP